MSADFFKNTVLVIDDEAFVLKVTSVMLKNLGFERVLTAQDAARVKYILEDNKESISLILCDLNMPDVDGLELFRNFSEMSYQGGLILFSAEDEQTLIMAEKLAKARNLNVLGAISKPINSEELLKLISEQSVQQSFTDFARSTPKITREILQKAIENDEIAPWFQPKIDVTTRQPIGVEALARWLESDIGPVFPDTFIPLAEEYNLIDNLTDSLLKQAANISKAWLAQNIELKIAVNISMKSLDNIDFPERLSSIISKAGGNLAQFQLEVTESQLMEEMTRPLEILLRLRMKKVKLSIDDFGTGHSNLNQLRELPFDELKLDRSYVSADESDKRANVILESSMQLATKLGLTTVAEGVETLEEWNKIESMGCNQVQGYFTAKPMPAEEIPQWFREWPALSQVLFQDN